MGRNRKQMLVASFVLIAILACYFGVNEYSASLTKKQEAEEAAKIIQVTDFEIADVMAFSYQSADLEVGFTLDGENWKCTTDETLEIDTEKVETFLENFNAIESENEITDTEDVSQFGLDSPNSSIIFEFADGESLTCYVGEYNEVMSVYYFMTDAGNSIYTVDGTVANKLSNTADNFIVVEEEEEAAEEETVSDEISE